MNGEAASWKFAERTEAYEPIEYVFVRSFAEAGDLVRSREDRVPHVLFVAADAMHSTVDEIDLLVDAALDSLCAYVCAWAPTANAFTTYSMKSISYEASMSNPSHLS